MKWEVSFIKGTDNRGITRCYYFDFIYFQILKRVVYIVCVISDFNTKVFLFMLS